MEKAETDYVLSIIKERFVENHVSFVYEDVCRDLVLDMAARGDFGFRPERVGRYWGKESGDDGANKLEVSCLCALLPIRIYRRAKGRSEKAQRRSFNRCHLIFEGSKLFV